MSRRPPRSTLTDTLCPDTALCRSTVLDAINAIKEELPQRLVQFYAQNKLVEAQRLAQRNQFDLEMMAEVGYCNGIENYSRHLTGRMPSSDEHTSGLQSLMRI